MDVIAGHDLLKREMQQLEIVTCVARFVRTSSEVGVDEGGCSREREQVRLQVAADLAGSKHTVDTRKRG